MPLVEHAFIADDEQILRLRLSNQHPVERISMLAWQRAGALSIFGDAALTNRRT